jgi:hypothetical protein
LTFIDMNNKESWRSMPGGFTGYLAGKRVMFETFNAIHIDIWSDNGSPLKFKSGHSMSVTMKVGS